MNKKNGGYSLVELIIVIAIMAIITGLAIMGVNSIMGLKAKSCSENIYSYMNQAKTNSLGFDDAELKLYRNANTVWATIGTYNNNYDEVTGVTTKEVINSSDNAVGDKAVTVLFVLSDGASYDADTYAAYIRFNRSSGAFMPVEISQADGTIVVSKANKKYLKTIEISQGTKTYKIECVQLTGKFTLGN